MIPETSETPKSANRQDVSETRIALTFFGGVSLAVYETGAAVEFFRLVTGDGVYAQLRDKIGPVVVDIISGTSAGALSAAFLANALINQSRNMDPVMELWLEKADLDTLFYAESEKQATSLLDGNKFLDLIEEALRKQLESDHVPKPHQQHLDLFITATSLEGDVRDIQLDKGPPIKARSHQRVFHFCYRGEECEVDEEKKNDFEPQRLTLLAQAARASASFPLAFDPVLIKKEEFAHLSPDLMADCHHIDGGILDNKPIKLAIEAIAHRQADKQIDRRLFYVEPLPEEINPAAGAAQTREPGKIPQHLKPINVLYAAVKDLPAYQSITSALEEIDSRNRELDALRRTLLHYETLARKAGGEAVNSRFLGRITRVVRSPRMWGPSAATDGKYHSGADILTRLFRAQEDGYLDLRLERHFPSLSGDCQEIGREIHRRAEEENPRYARAHKEFHYLKHNILWTCDFEYHRRQYHYLNQVLRELSERLEKGEKQLFQGMTDLRNEIFLSLHQLRALFGRQERQIYLTQQHAARNTTELFQIEGLLTQLRADLQGMPTGEARTGVGLISSAARSMAGWIETKQRWRFLAQLHQAAKRQLETEHARFLNKERKKLLSVEIKDELEKGFVALAAVLHRFYYRDMIIYPMMRGSEMLASELQPIRVARFGPLNGDNYMKLSDPRYKLAGEGALHFGGFMDATWRGNDLIWGRLDAVENIFNQLLPHGKDDELFKTCVGIEQRRIVREMRGKFGKGIVKPLEKQDPEGEPPHEDLLIGKQNLCDIPKEKKIRWLKVGIDRILRSIRVPGVRLPRWGRQRLSKWTQIGVSRFFVAVLVRPGWVAFLLWSGCVIVILALSFLGACALRGKLGDFHPLVGWTGDMVAVFWLLFVGLISLVIAAIANSIRIGLLKIHPPSDEKGTRPT